MAVADPVKAIVIVLVVVIAILFGFCCHFASQKRRDEEEQNRRAMRQTAPGNSENANQNNTTPVFIIGLQGPTSSSNYAGAREDHPNENLPGESPQGPDAIADSGPPPYSCLTASGEPVPPPPSYEEALRASTEHLAITRQQHIV